MQLADFDYPLPKHLVAQKPAEPRDSSRLMVVRKNSIEHRVFRDLAGYLNKGDVLVLNDSRVVPARLFGRKKTGGKVEALLIKKRKENTWECLISGKNIKTNSRLFFGDHDLEGIVRHRSSEGRYDVEFLF